VKWGDNSVSKNIKTYKFTDLLRKKQYYIQYRMKKYFEK